MVQTFPPFPSELERGGNGLRAVTKSCDLNGRHVVADVYYRITKSISFHFPQAWVRSSWYWSRVLLSMMGSGVTPLGFEPWLYSTNYVI